MAMDEGVFWSLFSYHSIALKTNLLVKIEGIHEKEAGKLELATLNRVTFNRAKLKRRHC